LVLKEREKICQAVGNKMMKDKMFSDVGKKISDCLSVVVYCIASTEILDGYKNEY
jgi:hypothetical protein